MGVQGHCNIQFIFRNFLLNIILEYNYESESSALLETIFRKREKWKFHLDYRCTLVIYQIYGFSHSSRVREIFYDSSLYRTFSKSLLSIARFYWTHNYIKSHERSRYCFKRKWTFHILIYSFLFPLQKFTNSKIAWLQSWLHVLSK